MTTEAYRRGMRVISIKMLNDRLSECVRLAEAGEHVLITDGDRVVAQLGPPPTQRAKATADAALAEAVREGSITLAAVSGVPPAPPEGVMSLDELLVDLDRSREDR